MTETEIIKHIQSAFQSRQTSKDFMAFLSHPLEFDGRSWTYAQFICYHYMAQILRGGKKAASESPSLTPGQETYYTDTLLGKFIQNNPDGNYCLMPEEKVALYHLENTLTQEWGMTSAQYHAFWEHLMDRRNQKEKSVMSHIDAFYHITSCSPSEMAVVPELGEKGISLSKCQDAYHQMTGMFSYVAPPGAIPMALRPLNGAFFPYYNPTIAIVNATRDDAIKRSLTCYGYRIAEQDKKYIMPAIMPWGNDPVEFLATRPLRVENGNNPEVQTIHTLVKDGLSIFCVPNKKDFMDVWERAQKMPPDERLAYLSDLSEKTPDKIQKFQNLKEKLENNSRPLNPKSAIRKPSRLHQKSRLQAR